MLFAIIVFILKLNIKLACLFKSIKNDMNLKQLKIIKRIQKTILDKNVELTNYIDGIFIICKNEMHLSFISSIIKRELSVLKNNYIISKDSNANWQIIDCRNNVNIQIITEDYYKEYELFHIIKGN